jgi:hypothetical protein
VAYLSSVEGDEIRVNEGEGSFILEVCLELSNITGPTSDEIWVLLYTEDSSAIGE